ncbi:carboxypeptidase-like regulatory domain-containing protein [Rufibacter sp. LB8]|uniref:carboxypeptidase-like regulatory domain-containing protein n=1 Tax=Rufibacter sp. LB8 TaxID=2777781 RepID=UPI00178C82B3|nr:carboxypeptidase-like regulatory domain-containing protein [Rufibacter sp. LB8]
MAFPLVFSFLVTSWLAFFPSLSTPPAAQAITISGLVVSSDNQTPVAYASVGLMNASTGTICSSSGEFSLAIPAGQQDKMVRFSAIGFEPKDMNVEDLHQQALVSKPLKITLTSKPVALAEVEVNPKNWETKQIGGTLEPDTYFSHSFIIMPRPLAANLGREIGIHINNGKKQSLLSKLNFCLRSNRYDMVKFRLNVYVLQNGKPGDNLLKQAIYVTVRDQKTGWMNVDLEPYDIYVEQDFVISLEWIDALPKTHSLSLTIPASMPGFQTAYHKDASQSKWSKIPAAGMGMNVELLRAK